MLSFFVRTLFSLTRLHFPCSSPSALTMELQADDVFLVWPTQFARHYVIEQSSDLAA
ncbi:MAG: hypothetical protein KA004_01440 [Verrucomicrobiales bacterium]|nr:hypothetical protein [Verrucomicrobiales bacterium]